MVPRYYDELYNYIMCSIFEIQVSSHYTYLKYFNKQLLLVVTINSVNR